MQRVFIGYRSEHTQHTADRIRGSLEASPALQVSGLDGTDAGDASDAVARAVSVADTLLVIVDEHWSEATGSAHAEALHVAILSALQAELDIIPILVDGAEMPLADELPEDIAVFADYSPQEVRAESWADDIAELVDDLAAEFPVAAGPVRVRNPQQMLIAAGLAGLLLVLGGFLLVSRIWLSDPSVFVGTWTAQVDYGVSVVRDERFEFRETGGDIAGSATYFGSRRIIEGAVQDGDRLSFYTRSHENRGSERRELRHEYVAIAKEDRLSFTLRSSGGFDDRDVVEFEARREP